MTTEKCSHQEIDFFFEDTTHLHPAIAGVIPSYTAKCLACNCIVTLTKEEYASLPASLLVIRDRMLKSTKPPRKLSKKEKKQLEQDFGKLTDIQDKRTAWLTSTLKY